MRFIHPRLHGILDYTVAATLIGVPFLLGFSASSGAATAISVAAGVGLVLYSLLTDYSAGMRDLIPWRTHLILDSVAAVALIAAPFLFGFDGVPRAFFATIGIAVLLVVATTQLDTDTEDETSAAHLGATQ